MDAVVFAGMVRECSEALTGARINKVHQPNGDTLLLKLWTGEDEKVLYLSTAGQGMFCITRQRFANPFTPPRFCQLLRARLSRLVSIEQLAGERLARFSFSGLQGECTLLIDFRFNPNLILLDEFGRIIDALHRDPKHGVMPGTDYTPGPRFIWLGDSSVDEAVCSESAQHFEAWLREQLAPMSPWLIRWLSGRCAKGESPADMLKELRRQLYVDPLQPALLRLEGRVFLSPFCPDDVNGVEVVSRYASLSEALDNHLNTPEESPDDLDVRISKAIQKLVRRQKKITLDAKKLEDVDHIKKQADLLAAQRHLLKRGLASIEVDDYYRDPVCKVMITLDPKLSPQENIDKKFKQVKKLHRGAEHVARRLAETDEELSWLQEMQLALAECEDGVERDVLARELAEAGYLKLRQEPESRKRAKVSEPLRRTTSPSGFELVWGKNPRGNDLVSTRIAHEEDLWFHVHRQPGCHLILRRAGHKGDFDQADIEYAAALAAGYSTAKNDSRVEVMMARAGTVRKPKGARPGAVVVDTFETIRIAPQRLVEEVESD